MKIKFKKTTPVAKPQAATKQIAVIIRWNYTPEFARALALKQWGKGRAKRNDIKRWALAQLDGAAVEVTDGHED